MTNEEIFDQWCPASSHWSTWAKPVLFTALLPTNDDTPLGSKWQGLDVSWAPKAGNDTAIVLELPGAASLLRAVALFKIGYQPVPLFNCCAAVTHEVLPTDELREYLVRGAVDLQGQQLLPGAPPAFILDANRLHGSDSRQPGLFDNRWMTFPQDFPSGSYLKDSGISKVILVRDGNGQPATDLAQVLLRWQETGVRLFQVDVAHPGEPPLLPVFPPPRYRWFFQRALALFGFMQNSAGGFGSVIPMPGGGAG
jgi:hypothetical protein